MAIEAMHTVPDEAPVSARAGRLPATEPADGAAPSGLSALLERARRAMAESPEEVGPRRPEPVQPDTAPVVTPAREPEQAPVMATPPQPVPPPVTIGEIHIHEAAHAGPAADPLALLAPYAGGLTARHRSPNTPAGAR
jgi:hypothetical protein